MPDRPPFVFRQTPSRSVLPLAFAMVLLSFHLTARPTTAAAGHRVTLNDDGVLLIDGRRTFPIAFTMPPPPDAKTPAGKARRPA